MATFWAVNADFSLAFGDSDFLMTGGALEILVVFPILHLTTAGIDGGGVAIGRISIRVVGIGIFIPSKQPFDPLFKPLIPVQLLLASGNVAGQRPIQGNCQRQDSDQPNNGIHPAVHNPNKEAANQRDQQINRHTGNQQNKVQFVHPVAAIHKIAKPVQMQCLPVSRFL